MLEFRPASAFAGAVEAVLARERARIRALLPRAQVSHTGGSSLPAALTAGDVDLHVRVPPEEFAPARETLAALYGAHRPEMWTDGFATFVVRGDGDVPAGVALTAVGGEHDVRFVTAWERLARDPALLEAYNALKLRHHGSADVERYLGEKADFFDRLEESASAPPG